MRVNPGSPAKGAGYRRLHYRHLTRAAADLAGGTFRQQTKGVFAGSLTKGAGYFFYSSSPKTALPRRARSETLFHAPGAIIYPSPCLRELRGSTSSFSAPFFQRGRHGSPGPAGTQEIGACLRAPVTACFQKFMRRRRQGLPICRQFLS